MAAGIMDIVLVGVVLLAGYYIIKSGVLNTIGQPVAPVVPITTAPVTGTETPTTTTPTVPGTTPTTPTTPAAPVDPLQALLDQLLGLGGSNTLPTQPGAQPTLPPVGQLPAPIFQGDPAECSSRYNGSCNTECKSGNTSLCQACQMACGGATIGAVQTLPPIGGTTNPQLCQSKYNGKCNTECSSGNSSECQACKQACGSFGAYTYYVRTPTHPMTSTVFNNRNNYSRSANWQIGVQNWK
jgi:hypothetical protein